MSRLPKIALLMAVSLPLSGCIAPIISYDLVKKETTVDPVTGDIKRTFYWRYDDGVETTTEDTIPRGEANQQRRNDAPRPQTRFGPEP